MLTMTTNFRGESPDSSPSSASSDVLADLRIDVTSVARQSGASRQVERHTIVPGLATEAAGVGDDPVDLDLRLEGVAEGVVVSGSVSGAWHAQCSRCLEEIEGPFDLAVHELYESDPVESETYLLEDDEIDLMPLVRDAVVLTLPHAPLCSDDCRGLCPTCGIDRNHRECDCTEIRSDPRWDVLDELRFDDARFEER